MPFFLVNLVLICRIIYGVLGEILIIFFDARQQHTIAQLYESRTMSLAIKSRLAFAKVQKVQRRRWTNRFWFHVKHCIEVINREAEESLEQKMGIL